MQFNLNHLAECLDSEFENFQKLIAKEKRRRTKAPKFKGKLEKQANAIGYTLVLKKDGEEPVFVEDQTAQQRVQEHGAHKGQKEPQDEKQTSKWNIGSFMPAT